jgi:hypothetical protein
MEVRAMALLPKEPADLALAPVAAHVDQNLTRLRDLSVDEIAVDLAVQLNDSPTAEGPEERAERVRRAALRFVDMHGWHAEITPDHARLRLSGGSVALDLGLSATLHDYIAG